MIQDLLVAFKTRKAQIISGLIHADVGAAAAGEGGGRGEENGDSKQIRCGLQGVRKFS